MKRISTILLIIPLLLAVACSSSVKKNLSEKKSATPIETTGSSWFMSPEKIAMERYTRMRESGMDHNEALLMLRKHNREMGTKYSSDQLAALRAEVGQNLAFYCFDFQKYGQYSTENQCKAAVQKVHIRCQVYNYGYYNRGVLGCVKRLLKMR